jgi:hypothetical protein
MNINQLSPEQVVFINTIIDALVKSYDEVIKNKGIVRIVELPMIGKMRSFMEADEEQLNEIRQNPRYIFGKQLQSVLNPVADIIKESMPELYQKTVELTDMSSMVEEEFD